MHVYHFLVVHQRHKLAHFSSKMEKRKKRKSLELVFVLLLSSFCLSTAELVDFTCVNENPVLSASTRSSVIAAYKGSHNLTISEVLYGRTSSTGTGDNNNWCVCSLPAATYRGSSAVQEMHCPSDDCNCKRETSPCAYRIGAFFCQIHVAGDPPTKITTVTLHSNAAIRPERQTITVNKGESVTLKTTTTVTLPQTSYRIWRKNKVIVDTWQNFESLTISQVTVADAALYECHVNGERPKGKHAIFKLIVRGCSANMWGKLSGCHDECPVCYNGGMCDDLTGGCICAPGFSGSNCHIVHGRNVFGLSGTLKCDKTKGPHSNACKGRLFCLQDPFGCVCAAGYKGIDCTQECDQPNTFGPYCSQTCHCIDGVTCLTDTGECRNPLCTTDEDRPHCCADGWKGNNCQVATDCRVGFYGMLCNMSCHCLENKPCHKDTGKCENGCADSYVGPACSQNGTTAIVTFSQINKPHAGQSVNVQCIVVGNPLPAAHDITVVDSQGNLLAFRFTQDAPGNVYRRTNLYDLTGDGSRDGAQLTCRVHGLSQELIVDVFEPPSLVSAPSLGAVTPTSITVTWHPWSSTQDRGDGPVLRYVVYYRLKSDVYTVYTSVRTAISNTSMSVVVTGLEPDTEYDFAVVVVGDTLSPGHLSPKATIRTTCGTPTEEPTIDVQPDSATQLRLTWELPAESTWQCKSLQSVQVHIKKQIESQFESSTHNIDATPTILGSLEACTQYDVYVTFTNRDGSVSPNATAMATTRTIVHIDLESLEGTTYDNLNVHWSAPTENNCPVDSYIISHTLVKLSACDSVPSALSTTMSQTVNSSITTVTLNNLKAFSKYKVSVVAVNEAGSSQEQIVNKKRGGKAAPSFIPTVTVPQSNITSFSIHFTWTEVPCEELNGVFRHYRTLLTNRAMLEQSPSNVSSLERTVNGLTACARYSFQVAVVNDWGVGNYSDATEVTTGVTVPGQVEQLTATDLDGYPTILQVHWTRPLDNCPIHHYTISYTLINRVQCERVSTKTIVSGTTTDTFYNITSLLPYSTYYVYVTASTSAGEGSGKWADPGQTAEAAPSESPQSVNVSETLKKGLSFRWQSPKCSGRRGVIISYSYILEDKERNVKNITIETRSSVTHVAVNKLVPYTRYSFKVRAHTAAGAGPYSDAVMTRTNQAKPLPVSFVTTTSADASSITVQWHRPDPPHGIITAYHVVYHIVGQKTDPTTFDVTEGLNQTVLTLKLTGLKADSNYSIQVKAKTFVVGELSEPVYRITQEGLPGEPSTLTMSDRGEREISISWDVPTQTNGMILGYTVKHRVVHKPYDSDFKPYDSEYVTSPPLDPNDRSKKITGLDPGTKYEILVSASTQKGEGEGARIEAFTKPASDIPPPQKPTMDPKMSTETSAVISIPEVDSRFVVSYLVTVKTMSTRRRRQPMLRVQDQNFGSFNETPEAYIAGEIEKRDHNGRFKIGNNQTYGGYYNAPLREGIRYEVRSGASSKTDGAPLVSWSVPLTFKAGKIQERPPSDQGDNRGGSSSAGTAVGVIIALVVCVIVVIGAAIIVKKRRNRMTGKRFESVGMSKLGGSKYNTDTPSAAELKHAASEDTLANLNAGTSKDGAAPSKSPGAATLPADLHKKPIVKAKKMTPSGPIKVEKLAAYVKSKKANNNEGHKQDYGSLPNDLCHPWEVARKDENKAKNRYGNIIAYDHSRVVLEKLEGAPHSDYVNASYIDGYKHPKRYIASQGPNIASMVDMWRMIWQEQTHVIVMVTHLVEGGKKKCEQYWPSKIQRYGVIEVTLEAEAKHADYIVRNFKVTKGKECRQLDHYHFISWPDMGLPQCSGPLLNFIDIVKEGYTKFPDMGPIIVHCSAGVGRTGSFITIDSMLDKAKAEGQVDIFQFVSDMRERRVRMVQTLDQYVFIFDVLLEAFLCGQTGIRVEELGKAVSKLKAPSAKGKGTLMGDEFAKLALVQASSQKGERSRGAKDPDNVNKNRFQDNLPLDRGRPYLMTMGTEQSTNYINASFINGYWKRDQYIITQIPMPNTTTDFWSMIHDYKSSTIIMLNPLDPNDKTMDKFWPEKTTCAYGPFNVQLTETESYDTTVCRTLMLDNMNKPKDEACTIKLFEFQDWPIGADVPSSIAALLKMINNVERWLEEAPEGPVTIQCLDGVHCSGVFCAILFMLDRMKTEKVVDVFQTVRSLRTNRPSAVSSVEQYKLCYETAKMHLDSFDIYENFR